MSGPEQLRDADGGNRGVLRHGLAALAAGESAVLGLVLDVLGSGYVQTGSLCVFVDGERRAGWLSGGCLESALGRLAAAAASAGQLVGVELDQRDDSSLLAPSAAGCRGRLRLALLPLALLPGLDGLLQRWLEREMPLDGRLDGNGVLQLGFDEERRAWSLPASGLDWSDAPPYWTLQLAAAPRALLCGAGPEAAILIPLLQSLGWRVDCAESRARWAATAALADQHHQQAAEALGEVLASARPAVALVMHHDFERDRAALGVLSQHDVPWIGLLGPAARRNDLFRLLSRSAVERLRQRLHAPVGLDLGGKGPAHIALSIAAALTQWRHRGRD